MEKLQNELYDLLRANGATLVGTADLRDVIEGEMTTGISVAVPVPAHVVEELKTAPTEEYYQLYHSLNEKLNSIVTAGTEFLQSKGYQAFANTTKVVKMDEEWRTQLPHKTVAVRAGLGWIGKNCLLVTPEYGSAIRLSCLVTDAPLPKAEPILESRCKGCTRCVDQCPGKALTGALWKAGMPREELFDRETCKKTQTERMKMATGRETDLCGLCFAVCPYTQGYLNRANIQRSPISERENSRVEE